MIFVGLVDFGVFLSILVFDVVWLFFDAVL